MPRDFITAILVIVATVQFTGVETPPQIVGNQTSGNGGNVSPVTGIDPAAVLFTTDAGMVLHAIKPASVADYEAAIVALQDAFSKSDDDAVRRVATAWRVFRASEPDAKGSVIYVHVLQPTEPHVDYRPSLWLDELLAGAPAELLAKYRDSFAVPPSKLSLTEFAHMSVAPALRGNGSPEKPSNKPPVKPPGRDD